MSEWLMVTHFSLIRVFIGFSLRSTAARLFSSRFVRLFFVENHMACMKFSIASRLTLIGEAA